MSRNVLPFKLEITEEQMTPHAGLAVLGEFLRALDFPRVVDRELPGPGSGAGYLPSQFVEPLVLMHHGGGRSLEDLRQIRLDLGLRELLGLEQIPSTDALGDWLRRMGSGSGLGAMAQVNRDLVRRAVRRDTTQEYTLDLDATQIVAEKELAQWTYKGERGYMPMVGHLAENGLVVGEEFREGNASPGARNLEFIEYCAAQMPKGKRIAAVRADSATYQAAVFNWCEQNGVRFAIGADLDAAVLALIRAIPEEDWRAFRDGHIAETVHSMNKTAHAFRLIVIRRPVQQELFGSTEPAVRYTVIASNRVGSAEQTVLWYNRRGDTSENRIKDLKIGFGMERMPCGDFAANAMYFRIGAVAYNLWVLFKLLALSPEWRRHQVQTMRWRLYQIAGKIVHHGGQVSLKVAAWAHGIFDQIRSRSRDVALESS